MIYLGFFVKIIIEMCNLQFLVSIIVLKTGFRLKLCYFYVIGGSINIFCTTSTNNASSGYELLFILARNLIFGLILLLVISTFSSRLFPSTWINWLYCNYSVTSTIRVSLAA